MRHSPLHGAFDYRPAWPRSVLASGAAQTGLFPVAGGSTLPHLDTRTPGHLGVQLPTLGDWVTG